MLKRTLSTLVLSASTLFAQPSIEKIPNTFENATVHKYPVPGATRTLVHILGFPYEGRETLGTAARYNIDATLIAGLISTIKLR